MISRIACLSLLLAGIVHAQDSAPAKTRDSGNIQVRFLAEQAPDNLGNVFISFGESKSPDFRLPVKNLSSPLSVSGRVMVLKTVEKEIPLCTINLPEAGASFAVILVTAKPAGYEPYVIRTDDPGFREGDVVFINRSDKTVLGKLGNTPLVLKPGENKKERPTGPKENTYYDVQFATREADGDKLISSSRWPIDSELRSYLFFFTSKDGRTSFRAVDEYLIPAAKSQR